MGSPQQPRGGRKGREATRDRGWSTAARAEPRGESRFKRTTVVVPVVAIVSVGLLVAAAVLVYAQAEHALHAQARARVRGTAALAARLVGEQNMRFSELAQIRAQELGELSDRPIERLTPRQAAVVTPELRALSAAASGSASTALISPAGRLLTAEPPAPRYYGQSFAGRDWYRGVTSVRTPYVSRGFVANNGVETVTVAALVQAAGTGRVIAILTIALQHHTQRLVNAFARSQGIRLTVTDQSGAVIASSGAVSNALVSLRGNPGVATALRGQPSSGERDGALAAYAPLPATGWTVSASLPTAVAFREVVRLRTILILVVVVLGAVLAACTALLVRVLRRSERSQRAEAERFRALLESAPEGIVIVDQASEIVLVNAQAENLFGYSRDELIGQTVELLVPERYRQAHMAHRAGFLTDPRTRPMGAGQELFALRKDGSELPVEVSLSPLESEGRMFVSAAIRDITARVLDEAEVRFQSEIARQMAEGVVVVRVADWTIVYANPKFEQMFGYGPGELNDRPMAIVNAAAGRDPLEVAGEIEAELVRRGTWSGEVQNLKKDGTVFWCHVSSTMFDHPRYGVVGISIHTDITERRRAEGVNRRLAAIVQSTEDAILATTGEGTISEWNAGAEHLFGYTLQEAIGRPVTMLEPPDRPGEIEELLRRVFRGQSIGQHETVRARKDGTRVHVSLTISPLRDGDGVVVAASTIARDITERKRVEEALKEADRLKTTLLRAAAHDFRSPLTAIATAGEASALPTLGIETRRELQAIIVGEANRLSRMVGKLLDLSRLQGGSAAPRQVGCSIGVIIASALEHTRGREDGFNVLLGPGLPHVFVDPAQLERAFVNLFENGKRFASDAPVQVHAVADDGHLVVRVTDDGPGIPPEAREQVFEPFFRLGHGPALGGSGLGLAIVRGFVEANGGRVFVEPVPPGRGATFVVELPIVDRHLVAQGNAR